VASGRFRTREGLTLAYRQFGNSGTLVCIPGGPGGASTFFGDFAGVDAILLDPRGAGSSERPEPPQYDLVDYADDLEDLRVHLGLEQLDLLGWSAGGFVSVVYASTFPERVRRLVLIGSFVRFSDALRRAITETMDAQEREGDPQRSDALVARRERTSSPHLTDEEVAALYPRELPFLFGRFAERERAFVERLREDFGFNFAALRYFNERVAPTFDLRGALAEIRAPTLILNGDLDPSVGGEADLREGIGHARVVRIPDAGHVPWIEAPDAFRTALLDFLA
jgi:pimeloyl-ACP methyl ester carboxylesterase